MYRDDASKSPANDTEDTAESQSDPVSPEQAPEADSEEKPTLLSMSQKSTENDQQSQETNLFGDFASATSETAGAIKPPLQTQLKPVSSNQTENNLLGDLSELTLTAPAKPATNVSSGLDGFDIFKSAPTTTKPAAGIDLNSLLQSAPSNPPIQSVSTPYTLPPANPGYSYYQPGAVYVPNQQAGYPGYQQQYIPAVPNQYPAQNPRYMPPQQNINTAFLPPPMQPTKFPTNTFDPHFSNQTAANAKISNGTGSDRRGKDPFGDLNVFGQK